MKRVLRAAAALGFAAACASSPPAPAAPLPCTGPSVDGRPLAIRCGVLVDSRGREIALHGINARVEGVFDVALDGGRAPLEEIPPLTLEDTRRMRALGFDALRLPLQWSGVEPTETGGFDEAYLDRVAAAVALAQEAGLLVLLDLHQDAYSKEIGEDGAPYWAILPPPPAKLAGPLDDLEARRLSKPVLDAFDTFFGESRDGARLRDRFTRMAAHVAARFADAPSVIGLELYNEPVTTSARLALFHAQVYAAVRAAAPRKLVFFEPPATRNLTDRADLPSAPLGDGAVYAPHVYTAAFGSPEVRAAASRAALEASYDAAVEEAEAWRGPLVVTEYGFPPSDPKFVQYMGWHADLAEARHAGLFFWVWKEASQGSWGLFDRAPGGAWVERSAVVGALSRLRLEAAAGRVVSIARPEGPGSLVAEIEGDGELVENLVSVGVAFRDPLATCDGAPVAATPGEPISVRCGGPGRHRLEVRARTAP